MAPRDCFPRGHYEYSRSRRAAEKGTTGGGNTPSATCRGKRGAYRRVCSFPDHLAESFPAAIRRARRAKIRSYDTSRSNFRSVKLNADTIGDSANSAIATKVYHLWRFALFERIPFALFRSIQIPACFRSRHLSSDR